MRPEGMSQEQFEEAQRVWRVTQRATEDELWRMACLMASKENGQLLGQTEFELRDHVLRIGAIVVENAVNERRKKGGTQAAASPAVASATDNSASTTRSSSTGGARRSYACSDRSCSGCRTIIARAAAPARSRANRLLGLTERALTPAAAHVVAQAGLLASFAEASERTLKTMSGLRVSESTVERTTEDAGRRVRQSRAQRHTQGPPQAWPWQRDAAGETCAYISLDHTGVRQQGPRGSHAEGKIRLRRPYIRRDSPPGAAHGPDG